VRRSFSAPAFSAYYTPYARRLFYDITSGGHSYSKRGMAQLWLGGWGFACYAAPLLTYGRKATIKHGVDGFSDGSDLNTSALYLYQPPDLPGQHLTRCHFAFL